MKDCVLAESKWKRFYSVYANAYNLYKDERWKVSIFHLRFNFIPTATDTAVFPRHYHCVKNSMPVRPNGAQPVTPLCSWPSVHFNQPALFLMPCIRLNIQYITCDKQQVNLLFGGPLLILLIHEVTFEYSNGRMSVTIWSEKARGNEDILTCHRVNNTINYGWIPFSCSAFRFLVSACVSVIVTAVLSLLGVIRPVELTLCKQRSWTLLTLCHFMRLGGSDL